MQNVNIKIFVEDADGAQGPHHSAIRFADAIPVFHRWIQSRDLPELLIDVADYSHVPDGPGVILIGHEANYSLDNAQNRPGMLYNRKAERGGSDGESIKYAYDAAVIASRRLESEPEFHGKLRFDPQQLQITLNNRMLYPNTDEGWSGVEPALIEFLDGLYGAGDYTVTRTSDPRERLSVIVSAKNDRS